LIGCQKTANIESIENHIAKENDFDCFELHTIEVTVEDSPEHYSHIIVDGVIDTSLNSPYMDIGSYAVRIGDVLEYRSPQPSEDEMYNITARNVIGRSEVAVDVAQVKGKVFVDNVQGYDTCKIPVRYR
jgi:hypothetical protein